jgi:hypothetical protein
LEFAPGVDPIVEWPVRMFLMPGHGERAFRQSFLDGCLAGAFLKK